MLTLRLARGAPRVAFRLRTAVALTVGPAPAAAFVRPAKSLCVVDASVFLRSASPICRGFASGPAERKRPERPAPAPETAVIYRGRGMQLFRALVRLKIFQLVGVVSGGWVLAALMATARRGKMKTDARKTRALFCGALFPSSPPGVCISHQSVLPLKSPQISSDHLCLIYSPLFHLRRTLL